MEAIFLIGAIQSLFFALLIGSKKNKSYADKLLVVWMIVIGLHLLYFLYAYNDWHKQFPGLLGIGVYFPTLHGPLFYLYFKALIAEDAGLRNRDLLHFVPFIIANALILEFHLLPMDQKLASAFNPPEHLRFNILVGEYLNNGIGPIYIAVVLIYIRKHQERIKNVFSYTENVSLQWVKNLAYGLAFIWLVVFYVNVTPWHQAVNGGVLIYLAVVFFVFAVGYFGFKQTSLFTDFKREVAQNTTQNSNDKYEKSGLNAAEADRIKSNLIHYLEEDKPYLNNQLSLNEIANALEVSRHCLSQVINHNLNTSFFDIVNSYRVEEFKKRAASDDIKKLTLLGLALECGFNSKASFNRIFKIQTGQTPTQYIQNS